MPGAGKTCANETSPPDFYPFGIAGPQGWPAERRPFLGIPGPAGRAWGPPATPPPPALRPWWSDRGRRASGGAYDRPAAPTRLATLLAIIAWLALAYTAMRPRRAARPAAGSIRQLPAFMGLLAVIGLGVFLLDKPFLRRFTGMPGPLV